MNRKLKSLAVFLLVSTISFAYAQEEKNDNARKGAGKSVVDDNATKAKKGVKKDGPIKVDPVSKPKLVRQASHETGKKTVEQDRGKDKRGFFSKLFGGKKERKEEDPN